jgi:DNA-binding HxlR family transcriptional regulator
MSQTMNTAKPFARSACAIANSLDIVGDKWSLLVVRDLLDGKHTYGELVHSPEGISTNILANRLKRLEGTGMVTSTPYQERPRRYAYRLTPKGRALGQVLLAFVRWGKQHIPGTVVLNQGPAGGEIAASAANSRRAWDAAHQCRSAPMPNTTAATTATNRRKPKNPAA